MADRTAGTGKEKTMNARIEKATNIARQGWLAYLGFYGLVYDRARPEVEKLTEKATGLLGELVSKGETVEATAQEVLEDVKGRTMTVYSAGIAKAKSFAPKAAANDRVRELEAEVAALNKKVKAKATKTTKAVKRTTKRAKAA